MCSYLIILDKGKISYNGNLKNLIKTNNNSSLLDLFLKNDK